MRKIVLVHRKKDIISENILERRDIIHGNRKKLSERKNGSFLEGSSLKEKFRKFALYAKDQDILRKISQKKKKQQNFLNKLRSMQMIPPSQMWSHFFPWKVSANLIAPKWRCVYLCIYHGITNSLGRVRVMKFSISLARILYWSNLEASTYSFTVEDWEGPNNFYIDFLKETWGLSNTV